MTKLAVIQLPLLIHTLKQIAEKSTQALQGAMAFDELETREAVDSLRMLRSQLADITPDARSLVDGSDITSAQREALIEDLKKIDQAEAFIPVWCQRYEKIQDRASLYQTEEGCHRLIDAIIPMVWDWHADILLIYGELNEPMLNALIKRGQKLVLILNSKLDTQGEVHQRLPIGMAEYPCIEDATDYFERLSLMPCKRGASLDSPLLEQPLTQDEKDRIDGILSENFQLAFTGMATLKSLSSQWLRQGLKNLPLIAQSGSLLHLKDAFKDKPLVIVSPGPSLDKNIDQLKKLKGKAIILAAVQSAKALSDHGITADLMMVIDPKDFSYVLEGADISGVEALIAGVTCNEKFVGQPFKQVVFCDVNNELDTWITDIFGDTAIFGSGGSVSVSALRLALFTGANPIALVGQDLALTNGKVYSSNSVLGGVQVEVDDKTGSFAYKNCTEDYLRTGREQGEDRVNSRMKLFKLPGYYGGEVNTRPDFFVFHHDFETIASDVTELIKEGHPEIGLFNCTEGGVFINGYEHIPLSEWIANLEIDASVNVSETLTERFASLDFSKRDKVLKSKVKEFKSSLREVNRLARECKDELQKMQKLNKGISKLNRVEKKLIKNVQEIPFISLLMQEHLNSQSMRVEAIDNSEQHDLASMSLYQLTIDSCESCLELLNAGE